MKLTIRSTIQPFSRSSLGMDHLFHPTLHWACDYLSTRGLKIIYVCKMGPRALHCNLCATNANSGAKYTTAPEHCFPINIVVIKIILVILPPIYYYHSSLSIKCNSVLLVVIVVVVTCIIFVLTQVLQGWLNSEFMRTSGNIIPKPRKRRVRQDKSWIASQYVVCSVKCVHDSSRRTLQWRHNGGDGVSNHQPYDCLLKRLFKAQIKESIKAPRYWPLWGEFTGEFPSQRPVTRSFDSQRWCRGACQITEG